MSMTRRQGRVFVAQALYALEYNDQPIKKDPQNKKTIERALDYLIEDFEIYNNTKLDKKELNFVENLISCILNHIEEIQNNIIKYAPEWPLPKIHIMDRIVLYIGVAELLFCKEDIPAKVVLNEAIELAKTFGNEDSHRFINGVLDMVHKKNS